MKNTIGIFAILSLLFIGSSFSSLDKDISRWTKLGTKKVSYMLDKDVIHVGVKDGNFRSLKILVTGGSLHMHRMVVEYMNGSKEQIGLKHNFGPRQTSRIIDLAGGKRVIKDITFWYDTKNKSSKKAKVHVFGKR